MARFSSLFSLSLSILVLFHRCSAQIEQVTSRTRQQEQRFQTQCNIQNINALEPERRIRSEAGFTDLWDQSNEQLQCANVAVIRHTIKRRGLLAPSYTNAPQLIYVLQGRGLHGVAMPGCPETYQYYERRQSRGQFQHHGDQHQKVRQIKEGDVLFLPAGIAHWIYNRGQSNLVLISLYDVGNSANQLDQLFRKFFLAGSPPEELQGTSQSQSQGGRRQRQPREGRQEQGGNIFNGFSQDLLAQALNIDRELVDKLQRNDQQKGIIVEVQDEFQVITPHTRHGQQEEEEEEEEEEERHPRKQEERGDRRGGSSDGLEETFCTMKLKHNIRKPDLADVYNPRAGRATSANGYTLPILNKYQLSMELVSLYPNAFYAPHWNINAHSIVYITRGRGRIQIASERGETVFDGVVEEGRLFVVPQGYAVLKKAGSDGLEWIAFKTNGMAKISQVVGRGSALSAFPVDVLANAFGVSREDASRVKNGRWELSLFSPSRGSGSPGRRGGGQS